MIQDKQWFIDRIGKRVYRDKNTCDCKICMDVFENGLVIKNESHATYLYYVQNELQYIYSDENPKKKITQVCTQEAHIKIDWKK